MNRHLRFLLMAGALAIAGTTSLQAEKTVKVTAPDGTADSMPLTTGTRISFVATGIDVANPGETTVSIPYSGIQSISFENTDVSAAGPVNADVVRLRHNPVESLLEFTGHDGRPARLSITSTGGARMLSLRAWKGEAVDVSSLTPGIYLLTIDNKTIKFIKK